MCPVNPQMCPVRCPVRVPREVPHSVPREVACPDPWRSPEKWVPLTTCSRVFSPVTATCHVSRKSGQNKSEVACYNIIWSSKTVLWVFWENSKWRDLGEIDVSEDYLYPDDAVIPCPVEKVEQLSPEQQPVYIQWILHTLKLDHKVDKDPRVYCSYCDMNNHHAIQLQACKEA